MFLQVKKAQTNEGCIVNECLAFWVVGTPPPLINGSERQSCRKYCE